MKRVKTSLISLGVGYPPSKKGFDFLADSFKEMAANMVQNLIGKTVSATDAYVLWGCIKTNASSPFDYSEGAIYFNGEVYEFPAISSLAIATADICQIKETADPTADPTEMTDGSSVSIHIDRTIEVVNGTLGTGAFNFADLIRTGDIWHDVGTTSEPAFQNSWANSGGGERFLGFKREPNNFVSFRGGIKTGASGSVIFTLPVGYRPDTTTRLGIGMGTGSDFARVTVFISGNVEVSYVSGSGDVFLDNLRFSLD